MADIPIPDVPAPEDVEPVAFTLLCPNCGHWPSLHGRRLVVNDTLSAAHIVGYCVREGCVCTEAFPWQKKS